MLSSPLHATIRQHGVCRGTLYRQPDVHSSAFDKTCDYCVLAGGRLDCYESFAAYQRGDAPTSSFRVVGASNPNSQSTSFRVVTEQNTHTHCVAIASDTGWLSAFYAGLAQSLLGGPSAQRTFPPPQPQPGLKRGQRYCLSCGAGENARKGMLLQRPCLQYGKEQRVDLCHDCYTAQGLLDHLEFINACMTAAQQERIAVQQAREYCLQLLEPNTEEEEESWVHIAPNKEILLLVQDPVRFGSLSRVSPFLESIASELLQARIGVADFMEQLQLADREEDLRKLKTQAFRVAGDMGTAMKLLHDHALPKHPDNNTVSMLQCILEFFLDLCAEGELQSVAFYWPQLCHVHLRMCARIDDASDIQRIDLMEEFLLTVATRYSIHLALELVWSHTADLEESLVTVADVCRKRRFAVLRFVCELESLLFDYEDGWGAGSVSLVKILVPTSHQLELMKLNMKRIQELRRESPVHLKVSARMDKLQRKRDELRPDQAAEEKLRIARNAEYFTGNLNFTKRLGDIAEKLRFMELNKRAQALEDELEMLNSSGAMGGDPLNRVRDNFVRIVRVPSTEGHVFRSKERTPVLLLVETTEEGEESIEEKREERPKMTNSHSGGDQKASEADTICPEDHDDNKALSENLETHKIESDLQNEDDEFADAVEDIEQTQEGEPSKSQSGENEMTDLVGYNEKKIEGEGNHNTAAEAPSNNHIEENVLEGAWNECTRRSPRPTALKKFGDPNHTDSSVTPKKDVENMVSSVVHQQLRDIVLPDLDGNTMVVEGRLECEDDNVSTQQAAVDLNSDQGDGAKKIHQQIVTEELCLSGSSDASPNSTSYRSKQISQDVDQSSSGSKRLSTLTANGGDMGDGTIPFAPTGDVRREVLNAIMMRGIQGNTIAAGAADSVQRSLKELDRKRATELLMDGEESESPEDYEKSTYIELESTKERIASLGLRALRIKDTENEERAKPTEEDECMESIRLLLIQQRVVQGFLSPSDAAKVLQHSSLDRSPPILDSGEKATNINHAKDELPTIDAGDVDPRLVGCGPLPPAILKALTLWKGGMVTNAELLELVKRDIEFVRHSVLLDAENVDKLNEDSAFWGRFAFGERWAEKKSRIAASSPQASVPGWDLVGIIVKSNDDLRQEAFIMQLIELCQEAFQLAGLEELWVSPYRILATGRTTGIIEMVRNAMSFDALKKRPGYGKGGLREHLQRMTEFTADPGRAFKSAQRNFVRSLAAYSLMSYFFQFKDRHNGNILLDTAGHVIHIDFGFVFGVAPGGSFSLEMFTPFKLTEEMLDVMGGLRSPLFSEFVTLFCCGFIALQSYCDTFVTLVEITSKDSTFKCFDGRDTEETVASLRCRFCPDLSKEETISFALDLIKQATTSYGTRQYDLFQYLSQGIAS